MRVALYYNPKAGAQAYTSDDLSRLLCDAGHEAEVFHKGRDNVWDAIQARPSVLIAAGGDGTVAKVAIALRDRDVDIPLYVLPLGMSNNIARTLGVRDTIPVLVAALASARQTTLDVGLASSAHGYASFVEGAGAGFFGAMLHRERYVRKRIARAARHFFQGNPKSEAEVRAAARRMALRIRRFPARRYAVAADGRDLSGDYLAVEVMNIRALGPRLHLAPYADPADGMLDLVLIRPEDREPLARVIESEGGERAECGECHRVREGELSCPEGEGHADDEPWPGRETSAIYRSNGVRVRVRTRGAVQLLLPR